MEGKDPVEGGVIWEPEDDRIPPSGPGAPYPVNEIVCYHCKGYIPADSKVCPLCGEHLFVTCPKCGKVYSSQYLICNDCGTNREEFIKEQKRIKEQQEREKRLREEAERKRKIEEQRKRNEEEERIREYERQRALQKQWLSEFLKRNINSIIQDPLIIKSQRLIRKKRNLCRISLKFLTFGVIVCASRVTIAPLLDMLYDYRPNGLLKFFSLPEISDYSLIGWLKWFFDVLWPFLLIIIIFLILFKWAKRIQLLPGNDIMNHIITKYYQGRIDALTRHDIELEFKQVGIEIIHNQDILNL